MQKRNGERKECEKKEKKRREKKWEEINISKVVEVRSLNLDLDLSWKDLVVKLAKIIAYAFEKSSRKMILYFNWEKLKKDWRHAKSSNTQYLKFGIKMLHFIVDLVR
jgi:hypothetical protein